MKMVWAMPVTIAALFPSAHVAKSLAALELPTCASLCRDVALQLPFCPDQDDSCLCTSEAFGRQFEACLETGCMARDHLTTANLTATACGYEVRDKRSIIVWVAGVGAVLSYVATGLRLYTRYFINEGGLQGDDWSCIATAVFLAPLTCGAILLAKNGVGKDIWTLPFQSITEALWIFYIQEHLYVICAVLTKLSLLLFYLRIFPDAVFRKVVWATLGFTLCFGISAIIVFAFQCTPIEHAWHTWDEQHPGTCVDMNVFVLTGATLNTLVDFWIIVLPVPGIMKLQSSIRMRLQIVTMFCTGFLSITGVSVYRAIMLTKFAKTRNPTWDYCDGGYWSIIEVDVSIICNCMPAMRKLLGQLIPKVLGTTHKATTDDPSRAAGRATRTARGFRTFKGSGAEAESIVHLIDIESRSVAVQSDEARETELSASTSIVTTEIARV